MANDIVERLRSHFDSMCMNNIVCGDAADLIEAIDALHQPDPQTGLCSECAQSDGVTTNGYTEGPCDTYRLLHPEEARREVQ